MPTSFFEIEHSTDIYNSLIKFSDLRDFFSNFCIVADKARKREFEGKISASEVEGDAAHEVVRGEVDVVPVAHADIRDVA